MNKPKRKWRVPLFFVLVGLAVLAILSAMVIPIFIPPAGRAASRAAAPGSSDAPAQH